MNLPDRYRRLAKEPAPRMLLEAIKLYGTQEREGSANNPVIMDWARETNSYGYNADSIPWCGLFIAVVAKRAGKPLPENPLWARNWGKWGRACEPELGCVLVFSRGSGGHVGLYAGEDDACYHVLGGNQGDTVSIVRIDKARLIASRNHYAIGKPHNVRAIHISAAGEVSRDES